MSDDPDGLLKKRRAISVLKGRGAVSNANSRYLSTSTEAVDDGWVQDLPPASVPTRSFPDRTVNLIATNKSPDIPFDQSINPYKGCEHGCIYCFARPTHTYLDLSAGLDFETRIFFKTDVGEHLRKALRRPGYVCRTLAIGTNTDPYQPLEKDKRIMREILQVLLDARHPVSIVTKSALILRDLDLLSDLASHHLVHVHVSVTTLSNELKTRLEPRTAAPAARLRTIVGLREAGVPVGAMLAPVIPFINDHELEDLIQASTGAGAQRLGYILIRLPHEVAPLFRQWLDEHYPLQARRVMAAIRDTRGGRDYQSQWGQRMVGTGNLAALINRRFHRAARQAGVNTDEYAALRTDLFVPPRAADDKQMDLF